MNSKRNGVALLLNEAVINETQQYNRKENRDLIYGYSKSTGPTFVLKRFSEKWQHQAITMQTLILRYVLFVQTSFRLRGTFHVSIRFVIVVYPPISSRHVRTVAQPSDFPALCVACLYLHPEFCANIQLKIGQADSRRICS